MGAWRPAWATAVALCVAGLAGPAAAAPAENAPGTLQTDSVPGHRFTYYLPASYEPGTPLPLLVLLHGCEQSAAEIRKATRIKALADREGFIVLTPETGPTPLNPRGCWMFWDPANQVRGRGEPDSIMDMLDIVIDKTAVDRQRVYVAGLSSGGAMAAILASLYPDEFAAAGVHSGLPFAAAHNVACGFAAMNQGAPDAEGRGEIAYYAQGTTHRVMPLIAFQGEDDDAVAPINAHAVITQFAQLNDLADDGNGANDSFDARPDATETPDPRCPAGDGCHPYEIRRYHDSRGRVAMVEVRVRDMGHAWSGGEPSAGYADPRGPDAAEMMWEFFEDWSLEDPVAIGRPPATCTDRFAANAWHWGWAGRMSYQEFWCDPWGMTWRHSFGGAWGPGQCP